MEKNFETNTFAKRIISMLKVDARRLFTTPLFYVMAGISLVIPILILVMTTMTGGGEAATAGFDNIWQIFGSVSNTTADGNGATMGMDLVSMCNIDMMYFAIAVLVCIFVADDFRSGYAKNLFTVRSKKTDYVISKTVIGFIGGATMLITFVIGALLGGKIAGLPFTMEAFNAGNFICSILSKIFLVPIFVSIYVIASVTCKEKLWLSLLVSFGVGMFLFNIAPMVSPLDSGILNIILCIAGGAMFAVGLGAISNLILKKTNLV
ncbi:MAG: ABC transporter permease [Clostridia bacterium]|nr:ABC transporter permease [Clostridia bacterium]